MIDQKTAEADHAIELLDEVAMTGTWTGLAALVPIDDVCKFGGNLLEVEPRCGRPVAVAVVLQALESDTVHVLAVCEDHALVLETAVKQRRQRS